jgi:hypothetical protein
MCRHNFYDSVRKDCETSLEHQVQPCPTAGFKCVWSKTYEQRVAAVKILGFCKSLSNLPFGETVASALLWSLRERDDGNNDESFDGDDISEIVDDHISDALEVLNVMNPHSLEQYCESLVKAFHNDAEDNGQFMILFAMRRISGSDHCCATLVSLGCFSILLNSLKMGSLDDCTFGYEMVGDIMFGFFLHEELGPGLFIELIEAYKAAETEYGRERFAIVISEIAKYDEGCITLISGGACTALIEDLIVSNKECNDALQTSKKIDIYTHYGIITSAISSLASNPDGCLALVGAGACNALIATFRIYWMNNDYLPYPGSIMNLITSNILSFMNSASEHQSGRVALIAADVCPKLITALKKIGPILTEYRTVDRHVDSNVFDSVVHQKRHVQTIAAILSHLVKHRKGQVELIKADACGALVEILKNPDAILEDEHIYYIQYCMFRIHSNQLGRVIDALVEGLHESNNDCARSRLSIVIAALYVDFGVGRMSVHFNPTHFVSAGPCSALVQAFKMSGSDCTRTRKDIVGAVDKLSRNIKESRAGFVAAGAVGVLKESLKFCAQASCSSKDCAVSSIEEIILLLGNPESVAVTGDDRPVKKRNTSDDI